jgi:putative transposase
VILAHRIQLDPTVEQSIALARAAGCARFAWNWALAEWDRQYKAGEKPTSAKIQSAWNQTKHTEFPWVGESPKDANIRPLINLGEAFTRFFKKQARRPRFKRKGVHDSFYVSNDKFSVDGLTVRLPVIGTVRMTESLRFENRIDEITVPVKDSDKTEIKLYRTIRSAVVSREADRWFISIQVDVGDVKRKRTANGRVGVDLGIKTALVTSDGQTFYAPKPLKAGIKRLRRLSRQHSRKKKGSNNRKKSQRRLARHHARIKRIRRDWTHKVTTKLCRENQTIVLEDLNVKGMTANHCLARAINDVGFGEIRRQLEYKAPMFGSTVEVVSRWEPTSKTCSKCGCKKDVLALSERVFHCDHCGLSLDRDLNAAKNILAAGLAASACGPEGSGRARKLATKPRRVEAGTRPKGHLRVPTN